MMNSAHPARYQSVPDLPPGMADAPALCNRIAAAAPRLAYAGHEVHVHAVRWSDTAPGSRILPHQHSFCEALLTVAGTARATGDRTQTLLPGTLQLHLPGNRHGWQAGPQRLLRLGVWFSLASPPRLLPLAGWPVQPQVLSELTALLHEARQTRNGTDECLRARFLLVLAHFLDLLLWPQPPPDPGLGRWSLGAQVNQFLRDNLDQPLTLADVATMANLSVPTLTRRYRVECGHAVMQQFLAMRLEEARRLLAATALPVQQVARRTGFTRANYFCQCFRRRFGCSPLAYRKSQPPPPPDHATGGASGHIVQSDESGR